MGSGGGASAVSAHCSCHIFLLCSLSLVLCLFLSLTVSLPCSLPISVSARVCLFRSLSLRLSLSPLSSPAGLPLPAPARSNHLKLPQSAASSHPHSRCTPPSLSRSSDTCVPSPDLCPPYSPSDLSSNVAIYFEKPKLQANRDFEVFLSLLYSCNFLMGFV